MDSSLFVASTALILSTANLGFVIGYTKQTSEIGERAPLLNQETAQEVNDNGDDLKLKVPLLHTEKILVSLFALFVAAAGVSSAFGAVGAIILRSGNFGIATILAFVSLIETISAIVVLVCLGRIPVNTKQPIDGSHWNYVKRVPFSFSVAIAASFFAFSVALCPQSPEVANIEIFIFARGFAFICAFLLRAISMYQLSSLEAFDIHVADESIKKSESPILPSPQPSSIRSLSELFSVIYFTWMNPIMRLGDSRPLKLKDIPDISTSEKAQNAVNRFAPYKLRYKKLWIALLASELKVFGYQTILASFSAAFGLAGPYFLYRITGYIQNPEFSVWWAFSFAVAFGLSTGLSALCDNHSWFSAMKMSIRYKAILVNEIYSKALRRIPAAAKKAVEKEKEGDEKDDASVGKIVTLMSTDAETVRDVMPELYDMILTPLHIAAAVFGLLYVVGWPALAGLTVMILTLPLTYWNSLWNIRAYENMMKAQDNRTNIVNEVLQGIRIIKYFAWERQFIEKINVARETELRALVQRMLSGAANTFIWIMSPLCVSFVTLSVLTTIAGSRLDSQTAFTCLSLFNALRFPLMNLPYIIADIFQLKVAIDRIVQFLNQEDLEKYSENSENNAIAGESGATAKAKNTPVIGFQSGWFKWYSSTDIEIEDATGPARNTERTPLLSFVPSSSSSSQLSVVEASPTSTAFTLRELNVSFPVGVLTAICGATGAGKSSILQALLGEMKRISGNAYLPDRRFYKPSVNDLHGGVAYVAQTSWLLNATIRENICFGEPYNPIRYAKVIKACALVKDLEILEAGDLTEIGEKGINLSGGQKQRISLARAVYSRASFVLMDDPLSAVDAPTARHLFEHAICGSLMIGRTRILVTHATSLVLKTKNTKYLVVVQSGNILAAGPVSLALQKPGVEAIIGFNQILDKNATSSDSLVSSSSAHTIVASQSISGNDIDIDENENERGEKIEDFANGQSADSAKLIDKEALTTGAIKSQFYIAYIQHAGGILFVMVLIAFFVGDRILSFFNDYWIKTWAEAYSNNSTESAVSILSSSLIAPFSFGHQLFPSNPLLANAILSGAVESTPKALNMLESPSVDVGYYIKMYALISCTWVTVILIGFAISRIGSYIASKKFHKGLIERILYAPMRFFDTTPIGRVLNRATKDISVIDGDIVRHLGDLVETSMDALAILCVVVLVTPVFLVTLVPIGGLYYIVSSRFLACQREIKRIDSTTKSPIYAMFSETLVGVSTIRAYGQEQRFMKENLERVDVNHRTFFYMWSVNRWFGTRVSSIGAFVILSSAVGTVAMRNVIGAGLAGLSLTWVLSFSDYLVWIVRRQAQLEMSMTSVERVLEYSTIEQERPHHIEATKPPLDWPNHGSLTVSGLEMRYAPEQPPVLTNVSFSIKGGEKVGIVGRTGAGKSSLSLSLFRIVEAHAGTIVLDGIDIATIGLHDLRSRLTMIPQDPVLFAGTIRSNLDPFGEYDDASVWNCLKQVRFLESMQSVALAVEGNPVSGTLNSGGGLSESERTNVTLESAVAEGGNNFSQGQRQLLCLARALLKSSRLTVFDEATASVDNETDASIQMAIRGESFKNTTVLSIAHRLRTIADYDKILVLEKGCVAQFGTPFELMQVEGIFRTMCLDSGEYADLLEMATTAK
ncbi:hypothetical protein HK100_001659 [Physocladia obscura]|uniref:ABC transporter n=1 Tax=Physocladia obscura TaxID=109957 RepID=A0AAD5SWS7_9FUNG|nr:hypothetical protein HK100_001659 [Physocladia obscura]